MIEIIMKIIIINEDCNDGSGNYGYNDDVDNY